MPAKLLVCANNNERQGFYRKTKRRERIGKPKTFSFQLQLIPDYEEYYADQNEQQPRQEYRSATARLFRPQFAFTVLRVRFVVLSSKGKEYRFDRPSKYVAYAQKRSFRRQKQHPRKQHEEYACRKESVVQNLHIRLCVVRKKAFYAKYSQDYARCHTKTNEISNE